MLLPQRQICRRKSWPVVHIAGASQVRCRRVLARGVGFERLDKTGDDDDCSNTGYQRLEVSADDAPLNPDTEDPELEDLIQKVQQGDVDIDDVEEDEEPVVDAQERRRAEIILALLAAGGQLPELMEDLKAEVDVPLLELLDGRIQMALEVGEPKEEVERMRELLRLLRRQQQRSSSTPALRLLDDLLAILGGSVAGDPDYPPRRLEAANRMQEAFTGVARGVDIFEAAAALADEGRAAAGEMLTTEMVFLQDFMAESLELLKDAEVQQRQLGDAIRQRVAALQAARAASQSYLSSVEGRAAIAEVEAAKEVFARRKRALQQVQDVALLARQIEVQNSPARRATQQQ